MNILFILKLGTRKREQVDTCARLSLGSLISSSRVRFVGNFALKIRTVDASSSAIALERKIIFTHSAPARRVAADSRFHSIEASRFRWNALWWPSIWFRVHEASSSASSASCLSPWNNWSFSTLACFCHSKGILDKVALSSVVLWKREWVRKWTFFVNFHSSPMLLSREQEREKRKQATIHKLNQSHELKLLPRELLFWKNICTTHRAALTFRFSSRFLCHSDKFICWELTKSISKMGKREKKRVRTAATMKSNEIFKKCDNVSLGLNQKSTDASSSSLLLLLSSESL